MLPLTTIIGRIPAEPKIYSGINAQGKEWVKVVFDVLVNSYTPNGERTDSFRISWFGPRAAGWYNASFKKGSLVAVTATISNTRWQDSNGVMHYGFDFICQDLKVLQQVGGSKVQQMHPTMQPPEVVPHCDDDIPF